MKHIKTLLTLLFISLLSSPSWSQTLGDLVKREGIYYEKFSDVPFTGELTGQEQGSFKNGERDGFWIRYYESGQLFSKGNYKNGKKEGAWVNYWGNGELYSKGNYKNGEKEGAWVNYWNNGQLRYKGDYEYGKRYGFWEGYNDDATKFRTGTGGNATVNKEWTGIFKNNINKGF